MLVEDDMNQLEASAPSPREPVVGEELKTGGVKTP
jgi:hypothetical protein